MVSLSLREAQLFRMLSAFFGGDRVIMKMSVLAICDGDLPAPLPVDLLESYSRDGALNLTQWAKSTTCLFTIIDGDDSPKMVIEFFSGFEQGIDALEEEHQRILPTLFSLKKIPYVTINDQEFCDLIDPSSSLDLFALLEYKFTEAQAVL